MDNSTPNIPAAEPESDPKPKVRTKRRHRKEDEVNEWINRTTGQAKELYEDGKDYYHRSPRLQKTIFQGKFMPAFWTVACVFSLVVNIILLGLLVSVGHNFYALKTALSEGVLTKASDSLAIMDQAHLVRIVPVETTVRVQDTLPVVFDVAINQNTQLTLLEETTINGARIYLNNTAVTTDLTLPAGTPLQAAFNMTVPVSTSVPVDLTVPVSVQVPVDIAIDQTDLHQSIVGLEESIQPLKNVLGSSSNSPAEFAMCQNWLTGWLCSLIFGGN